jgi:serine O-acetyltransferase
MTAGRLPFEEPYVSPTEPDWSRERCGWFAWQPGRQLLRWIRCHEAAAKKPWLWRVVVRAVAVVAHRFWSVVSGADIPLGTRIGGGLYIPHPNGIVVHVKAVIGPNCLLFQQVTIGADHRGNVPELGGHVDVGAGAKVIGAVRIGNHVRIGANAVVVADVPANSTAVGVPARATPRPEPRPR